MSDILTTSGTAGAPDPRDARIADLESENQGLRSQVADLTAELAAAPGPSSPPAATVGTASTPVHAASGFDREGRLQKLLRQGVSTADAEAQADYEQRLYDDRQGTTH
jgi:hypothetical protein